MRRLTPLKIGMKGKLFGANVTLKGIIQYVQRDDGDNYYWENIYSVADNGDKYWIDYYAYSDQYTLYQEVGFNEELFRSSGFKTVEPENGDYIKIIEKGIGKVNGVEGEIPMQIQKQSRVAFIDAVGGKGQYSMEWDDQFANLYSGQNVTSVNILNAFGLHDLAEKERKRLKNKIRWKIIDVVVIATLVIAALGILSSYVFTRTIYEDDIAVCDEASLLCDYNNQAGPIKLPSFPFVTRITVNSQLPQVYTKGSEVWKSVAVELTDSSKEPTNAIYYDLYNEYWVEGGESGRETKNTISKDIQVVEGGTYYINLYAESSTNYDADVHNVHVTVQTRLAYSTPFVVLLASGISYFLFFRNNKK